jgi:hypothetical protein
MCPACIGSKPVDRRRHSCIPKDAICLRDDTDGFDVRPVDEHDCDQVHTPARSTGSAGSNRLEEMLTDTIDMMLGLGFASMHHHGQCGDQLLVGGGSAGNQVVDSQVYNKFMQDAMNPTPPPPKHPHLRDSSPDRTSGSSHSWSTWRATGVSPSATTAASTSGPTSPGPTPKRRRLFKKSPESDVKSSPPLVPKKIVEVEPEPETVTETEVEDDAQGKVEVASPVSLPSDDGGDFDLVDDDDDDLDLAMWLHTGRLFDA